MSPGCVASRRTQVSVLRYRGDKRTGPGHLGLRSMLVGAPIGIPVGIPVAIPMGYVGCVRHSCAGLIWITDGRLRGLLLGSSCSPILGRLEVAEEELPKVGGTRARRAGEEHHH